MSTLTSSNKSLNTSRQSPLKPISSSLSNDIDQFYLNTRPYLLYVQEKEKLCAYVRECVLYLQKICTKESNQSKKALRKLSKMKQLFLHNLKSRKTTNSNWKIFTFGSSSWGTDIRGDSDIDMAISLNFRNLRADKTFILNRLSQIISENDKDGLLRVQILCHAKYPIIRIYHIKYSSVKIDISIADRYCLKRNKFMIDYMNYYERTCLIPIKKLIIFLKYWSKQRGINNSYYGYLNSFGFTLLIIQFIQSYLKENNFENYNNNLSHLVERFFQFYAFKYNPINDSININSNKHDFGIKYDKYCFMELIDPVNIDNNVAKNLGYYQFNHMHNEFIRAVSIISLNKNGLFQLLTENIKPNLNTNNNTNDTNSEEHSEVESIDETTAFNSSTEPVSDTNSTT